MTQSFSQVQNDYSKEVLQTSAVHVLCLGIQVRQHVPHKRTFFYLEQLILRFNADANCLSMKEIHEVSHAARC